MMKAQGPKFETCLFGPSSEIIPIKAFRSTFSLEKKIENGNSNAPKIEVELAENENGNGNGNGHTIFDDATNVADTESVHSNGGDNSSIENANANTTPPQTPIRPSEPARPTKTPPVVINPKQPSETATATTTSTTTTTTTTTTTDNNSEAKNHTINLQELRRLSSQGVPDDCTLRPIAWRVLLGYLPLDTSKWQSTLDRDRALYRNLVNELFVPSSDHPFDEEGGHLRGRGLGREGRKIRSPNSTPMKDGPSRINEAVEALSKTNLLDALGDDEEEEEEEEEQEEELEIPAEVIEQWRRSGRDPESLTAGMGGKRSGASLSKRHFNALLVTNNDTAATESNDDTVKSKVTEAMTIDGDFDPIWRRFLENAGLLDEIRKDVVRTHPDLAFFLQPMDHVGVRRYAAIERILFVWAKLNKGVSLIGFSF